MCKYGCLTPDKDGCLTCNCCPPPPPPPPPCGCNSVLSGEYCLNSTYYLSFPFPASGYSGPPGSTGGWYVSFNFGYCIAVGASSWSAVHAAIVNYMMWYYSFCIDTYDSSYVTSNYTLTNSGPPKSTSAEPYTNVNTYNGPGVGPRGEGKATNCYFWTPYCPAAIGNYSSWTGNNCSCSNSQNQITYPMGGSNPIPCTQTAFTPFDLTTCDSSDIPDASWNKCS